jgi:hypothetical protein
MADGRPRIPLPGSGAVAVAVLIDATVVRGILVPASIALLGERTWYLPRWLRWLRWLPGGDRRRMAA